MCFRSAPGSLGAWNLLVGLLPVGLGLALPRTASAQASDAPLGSAGVVVDSVRVIGGESFVEGQLLSTIGIGASQQVTYRDVQEAERRLWATGRFREIEVTVEGGAPAPVVLVFQVKEHPIVRSLAIEGLRGVSEKESWDEGEVRVDEAYSPGRVAVTKAFIVDALSDRGIPFAQVNERLEETSNGVALTLEVIEGQRVEISDVTFNGNDSFSDDELAGLLSTRKEGFFWWRGGAFNQATLEEDLIDKLPAFYASRGHVDFQVLSDTLVIDPETGKARLEVDVAEGGQYRVASFAVTGNRRFPADQLEQYYVQEEGGLLRTIGLRRDPAQEADGARIFDQNAFQEATTAVSTLYQDAGYLYASVTPEIERLPPAEEGGPPQMALRWNVNEGRQAYIRFVRIEGNEYTHDQVIRDRIVLLPGDLYSQTLLLQSYQAIQGLGFFETPLPFPRLEPDEATGDLDITFEVAEKQTGSVNFGTTMGGYSGVAGFIGYEQPNLFGQAKSGSLRWDFGRYQNNFSVTYSDPALFQSRVSGTLSLFDSKDRFFSFTSGSRKLRGGSTRFGFPVPGSFYTRFYLGYSLSRTEYELRGGVDDTSLFGRPSGTQSQVSVSLARNTTDHPLFPTVGSRQSWTGEFNGGILGGDGNFSKHRFEGSWWVPIGQVGGGRPGSRPIVFALGLRANVGAIFGNAEAFPFERFWMGGVQFGERLRGYEETTVTPLGYIPRASGTVQEAQRLGDAFLLVGADYVIRLSDVISLSAFFEAGNVWRSPMEIYPSRLRRSAGIGVEMVTPFGPFGLDYAYGFDRSDPGWQFHFRMGGSAGSGF
ncbi:MAG: outer membrane protein assembly factor BamA [Gemmatimonadetes bacterium]|nr:outer membrane protein assembly factor BamA [Gemmatimonadota bacterium]